MYYIYKPRNCSEIYDPPPRRTPTALPSSPILSQDVLASDFAVCVLCLYMFAYARLLLKRRKHDLGLEQQELERQSVANSGGSEGMGGATQNVGALAGVAEIQWELAQQTADCAASVTARFNPPIPPHVHGESIISLTHPEVA